MTPAISVAVILPAIGVEYAHARVAGLKSFAFKDSISNLLLGLSYILFALAWGGVTYAIYSRVGSHSLFKIPTTPLVFLMLVVFDDLCGYVSHRISHEVRFFWAIHQTHHSSNFYNLTTAARLSIFSQVFTWPFWLPLAFLGFSPGWMLAANGISHLYGIFSHTRAVERLGALEKVFVTPSHHRVHHGRDVKYLDRNYGVMFIVWDRLFGSFQIEEEEPDYGLVYPLETDNPVTALFCGFTSLWKDMRSAPTLRDALLYAVKAPGWHHIDGGLTASQMQKLQNEGQKVELVANRRGPHAVTERPQLTA